MPIFDPTFVQYFIQIPHIIFCCPLSAYDKWWFEQKKKSPHFREKHLVPSYLRGGLQLPNFSENPNNVRKWVGGVNACSDWKCPTLDNFGQFSKVQWLSRSVLLEVKICAFSRFLDRSSCLKLVGGGSSEIYRGRCSRVRVRRVVVPKNIQPARTKCSWTTTLTGKLSSFGFDPRRSSNFSFCFSTLGLSLPARAKAMARHASIGESC